MSYEVVVTQYNIAWPLLFEREKALVVQALGSAVVSIEHIGSTSVPNLAAKTVIDLMVGVRQLSSLEHLQDPLAQLGYEHRPHVGNADRHFFRKGVPRSHHLHMVEFGSASWERDLLFRDYLRAHADEAKRYGQLKLQLAAAYRHDRQRYTESKAPLMAELLALAEQWKRNTR